jgi:hypothetical protein
MTKGRKSTVAAIIIVFWFSGPALADQGRFGLGLMLGEPTGVNAKYFIDRYNALDAGVGWSLTDDHDFHLHADYLYHVYSLVHSESGEAPIYFGVGARILFRDNKDNKAGIRIPVGLDYLFGNSPFDVFMEIVPIVDLSPDTDLDVEGVIGARFFF